MPVELPWRTWVNESRDSTTLQWRHNGRDGVPNHQPPVCLSADQRTHQSSASLAFVRWIHRWPVNSPHKWSVTRKMFPFDDVIMKNWCHKHNKAKHSKTVCIFYCPACRTSLIATRSWVVVICPIIKCLTVLEFSFILFELCLFITIFNCILNYVPIVTFWVFTYHKIWILLIIFCFIWNYWIIYFLTCLEVFWSAVS